MHLIPRRRMRRVLVLLLAMSGLLAVPALALAHSDLSLRQGRRSRAGRPWRPAHVHDPDPEPRDARERPGHRDRQAAGAHDVRERLGRLQRCGRRRHLPGRAARSRRLRLVHGHRARGCRRAGRQSRQHRRRDRARRHADRPTTTARRPRRSASPAWATSSGGTRTTTGCRRPASPASPASPCISTTAPARSSARRRPTPTASIASTGCYRARPTPSASTRPPTARQAARSPASS